MRTSLITAVALASALACPLPGEAQFTVVDLGTFGGSRTEANAINNRGEVVGYSWVQGDAAQHAFVWSATRGMVDLNSSDGESVGYAINNKGEVVGTTGSSAFLWSVDTGFVDLGSFGGQVTTPFAINDKGQVVGISYLANGYSPHAFLWSTDTGMIDLGTLGGGTTWAQDINEQGQVVGYSFLPYPTFETHAFSWTASGGMVDLDPPGPGSALFNPVAVNDRGEVMVNQAPPGGGPVRAFVWTAARGFVDLGTLGGTFTVAVAINNRGEVVGSSAVASGVSHAFIWREDTGMVDLGDLGGGWSYAHAVNDHGQVVGDSTVSVHNVTRAFLWTAAGGMVDLGTPADGLFSQSIAVNNVGQVLGRIVFGRDPEEPGDPRAVVWTPTTYRFRGFSGVKNPPAFNEVVAGRAVSVQFSLGGNFGLAILDGSPTFEQIACGASASVGPIAPAGGAPSGSLIYKPEVDRYAYATKTDRTWAGTCRSLTLRLNDGSSHVVYFAFK